MSIIRKEKIAKPRILFLDFDPKVVEAVAKKGYVTIQGDSGFSGKPTKINHHPSEVEIIFWDCSKFEQLGRGMYSNPVWDRAQILKPFFNYVRGKNGMVAILLSQDDAYSEYISSSTGYEFTTSQRVTTNIIPPDFSEIQESNSEPVTFIRPLLERFVNDENIKHSINWQDNQVGYYTFYSDEDNNKFVSYDNSGFIIFPYVAHKTDFILCALQDCFPYITGEEIFPDMHNIPWLNSEEFIYPEIKNLELQIQTIKQKAQAEIAKVEKHIATTHDKTSFLNQALIADDSDAFSDENKLKPQVAKMLSTLGFTVKDLDEENKKLGQALKEDLQITDGKFFALVEVKGTEKGAKATWVRVDLNAHITEFSRLNKISPDKLSSLLVFNHDRRIAPADRSQPFAGDPKLIAYCEASGITLVPIYELYKLCLAVLTKRISQNDAKEVLKKSGILEYTDTKN